MISKNELKYIQSFAHKKHWAQESVFIVEGPKLVGELLESDWEVESMYGVEEWAKSWGNSIPNFNVVSAVELERMSLLQQPNQVIALVKKKQYVFINRGREQVQSTQRTNFVCIAICLVWRTI